ncbi:MAG: hypothetical protein JOY94_22680, partial [Methylobacteriaceae bacterium]|nr:hypothetical protein [Methylobacteriaceae bacterium]
MADDIFLGLDLGTSGCKLIAFDAHGNERAAARRSYPSLRPEPGFVELDPDAVWAAALACFADLGAAELPGTVRTLAISAQGEAVMPVDSHGNVLAKSPISADMRGGPHATHLERELGAERIYALTGQPVSPLPSLPKLMWWREHRPDLVARTSRFLCYGELALLRLGLPPIIDEGMAARTMAYDVGARGWSGEILAAAAIPTDLMPQVRPSGLIVGSISNEVASELRLPHGVLVVLGGHDQPMGALGAGVIAPGAGLYAIGTTESLVAITATRSEDLGRHNIACYPHAVAGRFVALAGSQSGGRVLAWWRDIVRSGEADALA